MFSVAVYNYSTKDFKIIESGNSYTMQHFLESHMLDFINVNQTVKVDTFDACIKNNDQFTKEQWDNNERFIITRSNNNSSKYTLKRVYKDRGYVFNSFRFVKLFSIYLIKHIHKEKNDNHDDFVYDLEYLCSTRQHIELMDELEEFFNGALKV